MRLNSLPNSGPEVSRKDIDSKSEIWNFVQRPKGPFANEIVKDFEALWQKAEQEALREARTTPPKHWLQ